MPRIEIVPIVTTEPFNGIAVGTRLTCDSVATANALGMQNLARAATPAEQAEGGFIDFDGNHGKGPYTQG